jgi:hypothetical protein
MRNILLENKLEMRMGYKEIWDEEQDEEVSSWASFCLCACVWQER